ncbi:MAG: DUF5063 domain-containing protein [Bacteroidota bacterium]
MSELEKILDQITEFGVNPKVDSKEKTNVLKKLLVRVYAEFVNIKPEFDETDYDSPPNYDYNEIRKNVEVNFPKFDWYGTVLDINKIEPEAKIVIGDAIDDLTDIIKDLLEVKWRFNNTSITDAKWHFVFLMRVHSEQHLVDLLKYIKEIDG